MNYWLKQGASRCKLVLGMPLYGRSFTLKNKNSHGLGADASGKGKAGDFSDIEGYLSYNEVLQMKTTVSCLSHSLENIVIDLHFCKSTDLPIFYQRKWTIGKMDYYK